MADAGRPKCTLIFRSKEHEIPRTPRWGQNTQPRYEMTKRRRTVAPLHDAHTSGAAPGSKRRRRTMAQDRENDTRRADPDSESRTADEHAAETATTLQRRKEEVHRATQEAKREAAKAQRVSAQDREKQVHDWIRSTRNGNTQRAYAAATKQFRTWATEIENPHRHKKARVNCNRPQPVDVACYIRYLVEVRQGTRAAVQVALAAITDSVRHVRSTTYDPCNADLVLQTRDVLLATARQPTPKTELAGELFVKLIRTIDGAEGENTYLRQRDALMILLTHHAFLRISEVVRMERGHVSIEEGADGSARRLLRIWVDPRSKNDAKRKGHERIIEEQENEENGMCLVRRMDAWLQTAPRIAAADMVDRSKEPLFPTRTGATMKEDTPRGRLKIWLTRAGVENIEDYGFHSLRSGGATDAARAGAPERAIQQHGNWKSDIHRQYIRTNMEERLGVGKALAKAAAAGLEAAQDVIELD